MKHTEIIIKMRVVIDKKFRDSAEKQLDKFMTKNHWNFSKIEIKDRW